MAYFDCIVGGSGKGNTLVVTCADELAGATITCTNGTKTYTKTCPSTAPYEVTFYGLAAGTWTISATVSGNTYTTTVVITDYEAELGGFNWKTWVDLSENYASSDFTDLDDLLSDETAIRELMTIHACVDYLAGIAAESPDVETIIGNDLCAKWINLREYALDTLYANTIIADYMDTADKYGYGEWTLMPQVPAMTSDTAPYGEAFADSAYSGRNAYKAFDNDSTTQWTSNVNDYATAYIGYKSVQPICVKEVDVKSFLFTSYADTIINAKIQGSNDNINWTDIKDVPNLVVTSQSASVTTKIKVTDNKNRYLYHRLKFVSKVSGSTPVSPMIGELQFYAWQPKGNVPVMTSNTAPYGACSADKPAYSAATSMYLAFDGKLSSSYMANAANVSSAYLAYKFVNPVKAKKAKVYIGSNIGDAHNETIKIQGSNDGTTWVDVSEAKTISIPAANGYNSAEFDLTSTTYYLYYCVRRTAGVDFFRVHEMQIYGRELSVSVPTMTGNTTPYGEVYVSGSFNSGWSNGYQVFTDNTSGWLPPAESVNDYLYYKFTTPIKLASVLTKFTLVSKSSVSFNIEASNDGNTWDVVLSNVSVNNTSYNVFDVDNDNTYTYVRIKPTASWVNSSASSYGGLYYLQFYGLDYSEKEFEEGTTKKWLYDHGVELENLRLNKGNEANNAIIKQNDQIILKTNYTGVDGNTNVYSVAGFENIDFTPYTLFRCAIGNRMIPVTSRYATGNVFGSLKVVTDIDIACPDGGSAYQDSATIAEIAYIDSAFFPNKIALDVSSLKSIYDVFYGLEYFSGNHEASLSELWLE